MPFARLGLAYFLALHVAVITIDLPRLRLVQDAALAE
jgi:hypothetical protein